MIDTHAHIHDAQFDADRDEVIRRAVDAGVNRIVTIGTSVRESRDAIRCAEKYEGVFATIAVHPEEYSKLPTEESLALWMEELARLLENPKVVAIGECGLDYHAFNGVVVSDRQKECQKRGFRDHLALSIRSKKPIVVHARESYNDIFELLRECISEIPAVVLHCYQGDTNRTGKFLELGSKVLFSFAGNVTYPIEKSLAGTKDDIRESIKLVPLDRLLVETDCPYLAPQKFRGTRNEPAFVLETARALAEQKNIPLETLERAVEENARRCFPSLLV